MELRNIEQRMEAADGIATTEAPVHVVTGAFGFSGRYIARRLIGSGGRVRTLTNRASASKTDLAGVEVAPLEFHNTNTLAKSLEGAEVLCNTYWVRFAHGRITHEAAVANSKVLIRAAELAGVRRIVHVSITNPSLDSSLPYFRGKAEVEEAIRSSRLSHAILRPAVLFGEEDILLHNIAWLLRRSPVFAVPAGDCLIQPIHADDLAALAVQLGKEQTNCVIDAVGPETYRYVDLVRLIRDTLRLRTKLVRVLPCMLNGASQVLGWYLHDVVLTRDEISGLMANLLVSKQKPTGTTSLREWLHANADTLGRTYASELERHYGGGRAAAQETGGHDANIGTAAHRHAWW